MMGTDDFSYIALAIPLKVGNMQLRDCPHIHELCVVTQHIYGDLQ